MIELNLRRTWYEISDYLSGSEPNPLRIAELINRFPPCCWTFKFTFDGTNRTTVEINYDRAISDNDLLALVDGSLEEIFFADALSLRQAGKRFTADTFEILKDPPPSNLITLQNLDKRADFLLSLEGFWQSDSTPQEIQQNSAVRSYFLEHTWLGSPDFADSNHYVRWIVFGTEELIYPENRHQTKLGSTDNFLAKETLYDANREHIGQASFWTSPALEADEIYTMFGPLVPQPKNWLTRSRKAPRWIVEIDSQTLEQAVIQGKPTARLINKLVNSVEDAWVSVTSSNCFQNYQDDIKRKQQTKAANKLRERQERARTAEVVFFKDTPLMLVPSNENEVLVLLCKLEALHALPFNDFFLWGYTARGGIDAIATYQISEFEVPNQLAAIEVESHFEKFYDHEHPPSQVNLVICWDFRDGEAPEELNLLKPYLFEYRNDYWYSVLVLSKIPNLQTKRS